MGKPLDLVGQKFGKLLVLELSQSGNGYRKWKCKCECGNICYIPTKTLRNGTAKSCGCIRIELLKQRVCKHSLTNTRLYSIWKGIRRRCYGNDTHFTKNYKDKGIKMCDEWKNDFKSFYNWAINTGYNENAPRGVYTIDRIDYKGNYEPDNCRWITIQKQQLNKSNNRIITFNNETHTVSEWANILNINPKTLEQRLLRGWDEIKAITTPLYY